MLVFVSNSEFTCVRISSYGFRKEGENFSAPRAARAVEYTSHYITCDCVLMVIVEIKQKKG